MTRPVPRSAPSRAALLLLLAGLIHGCVDEGNSVHPGDHPPLEQCEHFIPNGLVLHDGSAAVYQEWNGVLGGALELSTVGLERDYACSWLDADSSGFEAPGPECTNHWLDWTVGDSTVVLAGANPSTKWGFHLRALRDGTTTLRLQPVHDEDGFHHIHFRSREITVRVGDGGAGVPLTGIRLAGESGEIAKERRGAVNGRVSLGAGLLGPTLEVRLFGANSDLVDPTSLTRPPAIVWTVDDTTIALLDRSITSAAELRLRGVAEGTTALRFSLILRGRTEYASAAIPVVVGSATPAAGTAAD